MAAEDKEWSEDPADDPVELQKEQIKIGRELLDRVKRQEEEARAREEEYAARGPMIAPAPYKAPTFEEVSAVLKKAWDEVERIMPTAPDAVKARAFDTMMHSAAPPPGGGFVTG